MPESKTTRSTSSEQKLPDPLEVGYFGTSPKTIPNEKFSLKTGPDSPSAAAQIVDARREQLATAEASLTNDDKKS